MEAMAFEKNIPTSTWLMAGLTLLFLMQWSSPVYADSFFNIQCKGVYDKSIFAKLDRICEDCYNLYREPQLHSQCRENCFTTEYFKGCIESLLMQDETEKIQTWIKQLHGAESGL